MTTTAILMMLLAMGTIWGGLVVSVIWLVRSDRRVAAREAARAGGTGAGTTRGEG
ncbi:MULTISPECIES: methionine/alanine import family NSS transporter small subunit [Janibacter]|uniref:Methionine/alanine import family NSS transporter small subunit n=1 Tax=Janibacter melonis TaxID=262209 RepID=A0A5P8FNZ5_9MICO|nr:methionine/alanine import family NSS transporter small subunit [Janibacter melonis]MBD5830761.1 methionine/alanine import family NSS transporter small subunit [Janibacter melonis]MCB5990818.1 methionine/alanine import family NSS transporter small subunit [Janibacter melonis]QFQ30654.1 methionine/alanine import family NSS transporter small subunit [Janibacter melonis]